MPDKNKDIRKKSDKDLQKLLAERWSALRDFRFSIAGTKVRNVREARNTKREIARILTEISSRKRS